MPTLSPTDQSFVFVPVPVSERLPEVSKKVRQFAHQKWSDSIFCADRLGGLFVGSYCFDDKTWYDMESGSAITPIEWLERRPVEQPVQGSAEDAIAFANFIADGKWKRIFDNKWCQFPETKTQLTTQQLYELSKK